MHLKTQISITRNLGVGMVRPLKKEEMQENYPTMDLLQACLRGSGNTDGILDNQSQTDEVS